MTTERKVKDVIVPVTTRDGAGVRLKRSIATPYLDHLDQGTFVKTRPAGATVH